LRAAIWRNTILTAAIYAAAIAVVDHFLRPLLTVSRAMSMALAFSIVQIAAILLMVVALFARKQWNVIRRARSRRLGPQIQEALALHAIGIDQRARLEQFRGQAPQDVKEALFAMLASTRGEPREKVAMLAADLGFVDRGGQEAIDWIANLIRLRHVERFQEIVNFTAHQNLLVRAVAAEELAPYAAELPQSQIVLALQSADDDVVVATLDMLRAWRRAIHIPGFVHLLVHEAPRVRVRALKALPYAAADAPPDFVAPFVLAAFNHENPEVRAAAATAAGRVGIPEAVQALGGRLTDPDRQVAVAAALALTSLGEAGNALLQRVLMSPDRAAASVAFEALEKAALGLAEVS
jgi:HEAT repeat protein